MSETFSNVGLLKFLLGLPDLNELGSVALLALAKDAKGEFLKEGESFYADEHIDRHLYIADGEVELVSDDDVLQVIKAGSERAKSPLFRIHTHGLQARCTKAAKFLSLNEATYEHYISLVHPKEAPVEYNSTSSYQLNNDEALLINEIRNEFYHNEVDLPSMPEVALKINQAVQNESLDIRVIAEIVQNDPMISARTVQVANSAMYIGSQPVQTIARAVQRIGLRAMRAIVMSVALRNLYTAKSPLIKKRMKKYYQHSIRVGVISHMLAKKVKGFDAEQAFLAGLIHDIGIMPILIRSDKHEEINDNPELLEKVIADLTNIVGPILLKQWNFEPELILVASDADKWDRDIIKADYCDIIQVAQLLCEMFGGAHIDAPPMTDLPAYKRLKLGEINPKLIVAQAKQEMSELIHLLE